MRTEQVVKTIKQMSGFLGAAVIAGWMVWQLWTYLGHGILNIVDEWTNRHSFVSNVQSFDEISLITPIEDTNKSEVTDEGEIASGGREATICQVTDVSHQEAVEPTHLTIQRIGISLPVVSVPLENGTWKVYDKVANYAQETSYLSTHPGNTGIYGHDRVHALSAIKYLHEGDTIVVSSNSYRFYYSVADRIVVDPDNLQVFYPTDDVRLTLLTCDGVWSQQRYAVSAILVKVEPTNCV